MTRIAIVTDIHHGADGWTKKGTAAAGLMAGFRDFVAAEKPDLVLDLGDRISDVGHYEDMALEREAAAMFDGIACPCHHLCGNHDRDHLSVEENAEILGQTLAHETVDIGGWRLILWRAETKIARPGGFVLREADLLWLAGVVAQADRPLALFSHVPVSGYSQAGNYYFQRNPEGSTYPGAAERVREVLATSRVPLIAIAGHVHWNTLTFVGGQPHITLQSLTETFTTHPEPAGAYAMLELGEEIVWTVHGRDPFHCRLSRDATLRRWVAPLPPFDQIPELRARRLAVE